MAAVFQEQVQNAPSIGFVPRENVVSDLVLAELEPFTVSRGGPLTVERIEFVAGRGNVVITYQHPDERKKSELPGAPPPPTVAFMGSHMDVVPADPETWERDPFTLIVEGDKLYGRGTTDCLGHVALVTRTCSLLHICNSMVVLTGCVWQSCSWSLRGAKCRPRARLWEC